MTVDRGDSEASSGMIQQTAVVIVYCVCVLYGRTASGRTVYEVGRLLEEVVGR
jgi:hypothetical protein